ncbi:MAG: alpha/beta hydrolase [Pirellula sp.]
MLWIPLLAWSVHCCPVWAIAQDTLSRPKDGGVPPARVSGFRDEDGSQQPIVSSATWQQRQAQIREQVARVMGRLPERNELPQVAFKVLEEFQLSDQLVRKKIEYATEPNAPAIRAYLFLPKRPNGERLAAALCLHQTNAMGKEEPAGIRGLPNLAYALELAERGWVTLAPDYPSFGEHAYDFAAHPKWVSGSLKAVWDNMRAIDLLQQLDEVDPARIGCIGHSLGGHNAIFTAFHDARVRATVSSCGFTRFHKYYGGNLAGWTSARYMPRIASEFDQSPDRVPFDFPELIASLAPRAFFTSSPVRDANFEVSGVRDSLDAAQTIFDLLQATDRIEGYFPDCEHDFPPDARQRAYAFLERAMR